MFLLDAEKAHKLTVDTFTAALSFPLIADAIKSYLQSPQDKRLERELWGLKFPNPVGLAAGFDKDGKYYDKMAHLGFGFIEIGTVTPRPQAGNPLPRLFRLPKDKALINRMGFNNDGVEAMRVRLERRESADYILGANIGKNKTTPNEDAVHDYLQCFSTLHNYVDYFVLNVSSPNTPGLRKLQEEDALRHILSGVQEKNQKLHDKKPILLKISPDLSEAQLEAIVKVVVQMELDGIIFTNTTIDRSNLNTDDERLKNIGSGGLSGFPLLDKSRRYLSALKEELSIPIINVGGIHNKEEAIKRLESGADLIQIYTSLIYEGPRFIKDINRAILESMDKKTPLKKS